MAPAIHAKARHTWQSFSVKWDV